MDVHLLDAHEQPALYSQVSVAGNDTPLSDPQITTAPYAPIVLSSSDAISHAALHSSLGHIFAGGNNPKAYSSFTTLHKCNRFCEMFQLCSMDQLTIHLANWEQNREGSAHKNVESE